MDAELLGEIQVVLTTGDENERADFDNYMWR
jgi:hypothetical protein